MGPAAFAVAGGGDLPGLHTALTGLKLQSDPAYYHVTPSGGGGGRGGGRGGGQAAVCGVGVLLAKIQARFPREAEALLRPMGQMSHAEQIHLSKSGRRLARIPASARYQRWAYVTPPSVHMNHFYVVLYNVYIGFDVTSMF